MPTAPQDLALCGSRLTRNRGQPVPLVSCCPSLGWKGPGGTEPLEGWSVWENSEGAVTELRRRGERPCRRQFCDCLQPRQGRTTIEAQGEALGTGRSPRSALKILPNGRPVGDREGSLGLGPRPQEGLSHWSPDTLGDGGASLGETPPPVSGRRSERSGCSSAEPYPLGRPELLCARRLACQAWGSSSSRSMARYCSTRAGLQESA